MEASFFTIITYRRSRVKQTYTGFM